MIDQAMFITVIVTLSAVVAALWRITRKHERHIEERLTDCEQERNDLLDMLEAFMEKYLDGGPQAREAIKTMQRQAKHKIAEREKKRQRDSDLPTDYALAVPIMPM